MKKKILVIDDDKNVTRLVKLNLESDGSYDVVEENEAADAVDTVRSVQPDLILLDIMFPDKSGFDLLRAIKKHPKLMTIPVIMLTAMNDDWAKTRAMELFTEGYVVKPVAMEVLRAEIEHALSMSAGDQTKDVIFPERAGKETASSTMIGRAHTPQETKEYLKQQAKVLIIDNEQSICEVIQHYLEPRGFTVRTCSESRDAFSAFLAEDPEIVLLDLIMPGVSGLEILKRIKERSRETRVIMLTGANDEIVIRDAMGSGADDIIIKPFSMDQLRATLIKHISTLRRAL